MLRFLIISIVFHVLMITFNQGGFNDSPNVSKMKKVIKIRLEKELPIIKPKVKIFDLANKKKSFNSKDFYVGPIGMSRKATTKNMGTNNLSILHSYIKTHLDYPSAFRFARISGGVTARIYFRKDGVVEFNKTILMSDSIYLKAFMKRALLNAFKEKGVHEIVPHYLFKEKNNFFDIEIHVTEKANFNRRFISDKSYYNEAVLSFLVQNDEKHPSLSSPGDTYDYIKDNFTEAGKVKKIFYERQLDDYVNVDWP